MPITSASEFEAVLTRVLMKIDRELVERRGATRLEEARRIIDKAQAIARDTAKLKAYQAQLLSAGEVLREEMGRDQELGEQTWDLVDYIEYHLG
jgi:hypothetical protein